MDLKQYSQAGALAPQVTYGARKGLWHGNEAEGLYNSDLRFQLRTGRLMLVSALDGLVTDAHSTVCLAVQFGLAFGGE